MKTEFKKEEKKKEKKSERVLPPCNENVYIVNRNKIRRDIGLTENAKIIME